MNSSKLENVEETKIIRLIMTPNLGKWKNTQHLVKKAKKLFIINFFVKFAISTKYSGILYIQFIRPSLELNYLRLSIRLNPKTFCFSFLSLVFSV